MLHDETDRDDLSKRMREAEHAGDETTHAIVRRVNTTFVTPFDREDIYALASGLDDVMDMMEEAVDLILLYEVDELPAELANQVEVLQRCAELTADGDAAAAVDEGPRGVLDRDQPARERRRQDLPPDPRQAVQRRVRRAEVLKLKDIVDAARGRRSTPSRRSPTSSSRSRSRSPDRVELAIVIAVVVVALVFDYTNGFHDAANAIATSVSTRALTPRVALAMAAVMNFVGAFLGPGGRQDRRAR